MTSLRIALALALFAAAPVSAQDLGTMLPSLTFPEDEAVTSAAGCGSNPPAPTCVVTK